MVGYILNTANPWEMSFDARLGLRFGHHVDPGDDKL